MNLSVRRTSRHLARRRLECPPPCPMLSLPRSARHVEIDTPPTEGGKPNRAHTALMDACLEVAVAPCPRTPVGPREDRIPMRSEDTPPWGPSSRSHAPVR